MRPVLQIMTVIGGGLLAAWPACTAGCVTTEEINAVRADVERLEQDIGMFNLHLAKSIQTDGGDVNEPITGWILATGYALVPVSFLGYLFAHRSKLFRRAKDRLRGKFTISGA